MDSPKSRNRPWQSRYVWREPHKIRKHLNKKFYNSKAWRDTRKAYITALEHKVWQSAKDRVWNLKGAELEMEAEQCNYLFSISFIPCEQCVKLLAVGQYDSVNEGKELDHIDPLNPENALDSKGWGNPFDHDNLQLLCRRHHAIKSNRDKKIIKNK